MGTLVTPQYVKDIASRLDVKAGPEWALPFALASAPLPYGWTYIIADDGSVSFVNDLRPQSPQHEHPLLAKASQALEQLRAGGPSVSYVSGDTRLLGPFENLDSPAVEHFYLDILTGQQVLEFESPHKAIIQPLHEDIRRLLSVPATSSSPSSPSLGAEKEQQGSQQGSQQMHPVEEGFRAKADVRPGARVQADVHAEGVADTVKALQVAQDSDAKTPVAGLEPNGSGTGTGLSGEAAGTAGPANPSAEAPKPQDSNGAATTTATTTASTAASTGTSATAAAAGSHTQHASAAAPTLTGRHGFALSPPLKLPLSATTAAAGSSKSLGLGSDDYEDSDGVAYVRGESTTAGYAGSVSQDSSGSGKGSGNVGAGQGDKGGHISGTGRPSSGSGGAEALSRSGSGRSAGSAGSGRDGGSHNSDTADSGGTRGVRVGVRAPVAPPSGRLTFHGWWFEDVESSDLTFRIDAKTSAGGGLAPRHCTLVYEFATSSFIFTMRDPVTPPAPGQPYERIPVLTVPGIGGEQVAMCDTGRSADLWDLHLGARLRVLGRQVLLKNSDLATSQWHAAYFRQLSGLRDKLHQEVQKYKPRVLRPGLVADKGDVRLQTGQQLRHMALQVRELIEDLRQYRPLKAEKFMTALPIQF